MTSEIDKFSVGQAAKVLGVSVKTLHRWDQNGRLVAHRRKSKHRYYTRLQLEEFMKNVRSIKHEREVSNGN